MDDGDQKDRKFSLNAYPLSWPNGWKRMQESQRVRSPFSRIVTRPRSTWTSSEDLTVSQATKRVLDELSRMGINENDVVISTNIRLRLDGLPRSDARKPEDPGAAVYWRKGQNGPMKCIAVDRYTAVEGNLAAIAATLEAMRAIERHGGAEILERTFQGFAALPAQASSSWRETLGFEPDERVSLLEVNSRFRELSKTHHPDGGGSGEKFREITEARAAARMEFSSR